MFAAFGFNSCFVRNFASDCSNKNLEDNKGKSPKKFYSDSNTQKVSILKDNRGLSGVYK